MLQYSCQQPRPNLFAASSVCDIVSLGPPASDGRPRVPVTHVEPPGPGERTGQYTYQASAFALWVDDLIEEQSATPSTNSAKPAMELVNVDQGRFWGGDLSLEHQLTTTVAHSHSLGVVMGEVQDGASITPSRRASPLQGRHRLAQQWSKSGGVR